MTVAIVPLTATDGFRASTPSALRGMAGVQALRSRTKVLK